MKEIKRTEFWALEAILNSPEMRKIVGGDLKKLVTPVGDVLYRKDGHNWLAMINGVSLADKKLMELLKG